MPEPKIVYTNEETALLEGMTASMPLEDFVKVGVLRYMAINVQAKNLYEYLSQQVTRDDTICQLYRDLLFRVPLTKLPIHINHQHPGVRLLVKWRLKIGK